jgi:hypothetical protein
MLFHEYLSLYFFVQYVIFDQMNMVCVLSVYDLFRISYIKQVTCCSFINMRCGILQCSFFE